MVMAVYVAAVTGFIFLVVVSFCFGNVDEVAMSPTGVPLIQILYDSTQSKVGTCLLASLTVVIGMFATAGLLVSTSL